MLWGSWIHLCTVISLLQKQLAGSKLKGWLCIDAYLGRKYLNKLEKHILGFIKFATLITTPHSVTITAKLYIVYCGKQSLGFLFLDNLSALTGGNYKILCIASSFHNISFGAQWGIPWDVCMYLVKSWGVQNCKVYNILLNLLWGAWTFVH